ncbi:hypothetical protein LCGC14_3040720, partial [marine sediment metagenome]
PSAASAGTNSGLDSLQSIALSADGASLYAASPGDDAVARFSRNPATGEQIKKEADKVVKMTIAKALKDSVNG